MSERLEAVQQVAQSIANADQDGICTAEALVDAARDANSPIHGEFEWDDTVAGEEWRREQARRLLRRIVIHRPEQRDRYVPVTVTRPGVRRTGYMPASEAFSNPELRSQVLAEAMAGVRGWIKRYRSLQELAELANWIEEGISKFGPEI